jgi:hypothetical protein
MSAERISALLATANEDIVNGEYAKASEILREASHLEPSNVKVQEAWKFLQSKSTTRDAVESIRNYIGSKQEEYGKKALQDLKEGQQLGPHESSELSTCCFTQTQTQDCFHYWIHYCPC